jgi:hypothetical protein
MAVSLIDTLVKLARDNRTVGAATLPSPRLALFVAGPAGSGCLLAPALPLLPAAALPAAPSAFASLTMYRLLHPCFCWCAGVHNHPPAVQPHHLHV